MLFDANQAQVYQYYNVTGLQFIDISSVRKRLSVLATLTEFIILTVK